MKKNRNWVVLFIGIALMMGAADYLTQAIRLLLKP